MNEASSRPPRAVWLIIFLFFCVATWVQFLVPIDFGPDEPFHVESVYDIAANARIPRLYAEDGIENHIAQHPPVYYAAMAVLWKISGATERPLGVTRGIVSFDKHEPKAVLARRLMRLASALLGCLMLWFIARTLALLDIPQSWQIFLLTWAAAWPMLQYVCGVVNNESLAYAYSAWVCYVIVARWQSGVCSPRQAFLLGLLCGAGALVKQNTLFAAPVALWVVWVCSEKRIAALAAFFGGVLGTGIWWPLHNVLQASTIFTPATRPYNQPTLEAIKQDWLGLFTGWSRALLESALVPDWSWYFVKREFETATMLLGVSGLVFFFVRGLLSRQESAQRFRGLRVASFGAMVLLFVLVLQYAAFQDQRAQMGGRYLMNAMPWAIVFLATCVPLGSTRRNAEGETTIAPPGLASYIVLGFLLLVCAAWWFLAWTYYDTMIAQELQRRAAGG